MKKYNLINNIFGWVSFAIAAVVYCLTIEPSASFWDCGEFITTAYKLEVGHPPGAPFFMLTGKFFSLFASDPSQVAAMINIMSALMSALTILFLFWTITHLAKKLIYPDSSKSKEMTMGQLIAIMSAGLVGALAYTFSDTFWFSAVEGEVYAYSSMFTALVFWLILKWENRSDQVGADRWLIIIAYAMGLSIGVHLLNLLCIPAIVLIYYFKKTEKPDLKGTLLALLGSFGLIVVLMYGIIPGFSKVGGWFELFFVNTLGFSYNSGVFAYLILVALLLIWGLFETFSSKGNMNRAKVAFVLCMTITGVVFISSSVWIWLILLAGLIAFMVMFKGLTVRMLNTSLLCLMVILIGYSSFALIPIRSTANPPMDQNSPEDAFSLAGYLNREQYGDSPLFYGRTYASTGKLKEGKISDKKYGRVVKNSPDEKDKYVVEAEIPEVEYSNTMLFPRMHADKNQPNYDIYMQGYANWGGVTNPNKAPTFFQNLQFFFSYQINHMYIRYFMWNFSGRQNDIQGRGGITDGNWITGISFIDEYILGLGPQDDLPPDMADSKGRNKFYMLPLILGLLGIIYQITRDERGKQQFWVTFMLFFMTGLAIVVYLNQKPAEPRERDYAYAGSFYAFAIWIGLGVPAIWALLKKRVAELPASVIAAVACICVPIQMATQTWDDHDRSGRYIMHDVAMNYLKSCEKDAIIFTNGDNDTFPLWYIQEVEGYRTDVRVCNLSYLQTDWYVDQMRRPYYDSPALPIDWERSAYMGGKGQSAMVMTNRLLEGMIKEDIRRREGIRDDDAMGMYRLQTIDVSGLYDTAFKDTVLLKDAMAVLRSGNDTYKRPDNLKMYSPVVPGINLKMDIDTTAVNWANLGTEPLPEMYINLGENRVGRGVSRSELMMLEMISNINETNWKRPIYFATTVGTDMYMGLQSNFMMKGLTNRIVPGIRPNKEGVDTEVTFNNLVNEFVYRGINDPNVYLDETNMRTCKTYRLMFRSLIGALIEEGKKDKALKALDKCLEVVPGTTVPFGAESILFADCYYELGEVEKGRKLLGDITDRSSKTLNWLNRVKEKQMKNLADDIRSNIYTILMSMHVAQAYGDSKTYMSYVDQLLSYVPVYYSNRVSIYEPGMRRSIGLGDYILANMLSTSYTNGEKAMQEKDMASLYSENEATGKILEVMKRYNPRLYDQYKTVTTNPAPAPEPKIENEQETK
ncbi:DUF2723 domain-containing protein [Dysgonomonas sp. 520]|uniref:glycosyltransferase family 117 protein n=1 Tax=Dysgonomonas sp. 520 TaxID=2302931 RepID=UPI0013D2E136|nr:DUF2723 domain-containing protein [Dysgonomonas sp. 520]NDW10315.1 DUF2723 domain-containing protein [Dysgonomonas sp. 520]